MIERTGAAALLLAALASCGPGSCQLLAGEGEGEAEGEGEGEAEEPLSELRVTPAECDFGEVPLGGSRSCVVALTNAGPRPVEVVAVTLASFTEVYSLPASFVGPVEAGATLAVRVIAHPISLGAVDSTLVINVEGTTDPVRMVPLSVTGIAPPVCVARVSSVNDVEILPGGAVPNLHPLDRVVLSLDQSSASPAGAISAYEWGVQGRPVGSTVQLTTPTAESTGFTFDDRFGLDLTGTYVVLGTVFDGDVAVSCSLELAITPHPEGLLVQLSWDSPQGDLDLHLRRDTEALCSAADCYSLTCGGGGPDWGSPDASPRLDADGIGFGPETITLDAPADATYLVAVHGRELPAPANATVRVFLDGSLTYESSSAVAGGEAWHVAAISCGGGSCEASPDGASTPLASCAP